MTVDPTDNLIVQRGSTLGKIEVQNMATIQNNDLLIVGRGSDSFKITGQDFKNSLAGGVDLQGSAVVAPTVADIGDTLTCTASAAGGTTPYTFDYQWFCQLDGTVDWVEHPGSNTDTVVLDAGDVDYRFRCHVTVTGANGGTLNLISNETGVIGDPALAPIIGNVSLVETNPDADPRFTDQEFVASVSMTEDGVPVSTKTIDAYVEGTITTTGQFDEPLESSAARENSTLLYVPSGSVVNPGNAFDGNESTHANASSGTRLTWGDDLGISGITKLEIYQSWNPPSIQSYEMNYFPNDTGAMQRHDFTGNANPHVVTVADLGVSTFTLYSLQIDNLSNLPRLNGIKINDEWVSDQINTLNFAPGTDMSTLAAGDIVEQTTTLNNYIFSDDLSSDGGFPHGDKTLAFNGVIDSLNSAALNLNGGATFTFDMSKYPVAAGKTITMYVGSNMNLEGYNSADQRIAMDTSPATNQVHAVSFSSWGSDEITKLTFYSSGGATRLCGIAIDGVVLVDGDSVAATTTGTVGSITDTTVALSSSSGTWTDGVNVTGPEKTITTDNAKKYLKFESDGTVTDLLDAPQDPPYETTDTNPGLTFTFPATFPSGSAPDDELGDGTKLVVEATATNSAGTSGPVTAEVQPEGAGAPPLNLNALTSVWAGNGAASRDIVNGIDLVNHDGLVWIKDRTYDGWHQLYDTLRGPALSLVTNNNDAQSPLQINKLDAFNVDGFQLGNHTYVNGNGYNYVAWTFQKAAGYFDVIKHNKTSDTDTVQHNLGQKPGFIIVKSINTNHAWLTYHSAVGHTKYGVLSDTRAFADDSGNTAFVDEPTDTEFKIGSSMGPDGDYICYLFAEDMPGLIKCGSYTGNGSPSGPTVDLGFEPQFVMIKNTSDARDWVIHDSKRGFTPGNSSSQVLHPNQTIAESATSVIQATSTGFRLTNVNSMYNAAGNIYVYVAIAKPTTRSLTQEEFNEQAIKFGTYDHRKHVECARLSEENRDALIQYFADKGYSLQDILSYL